MKYISSKLNVLFVFVFVVLNIGLDVNDNYLIITKNAVVKFLKNNILTFFSLIKLLELWVFQ